MKKRKTEVKQKDKIRSLDFEIFGYRANKQEKVMTIGLVADRRDTYRTVIVPSGCLTPIEGVLVDYNHNFINTGCYMEDLGIQTRDFPDGNGGLRSSEVRVVDVHVPLTAKAYTKDNKDNANLNEIPSLYEFVETGRVRWGSVYFTPDDDSTEYVRDSTGKLLREVYNKWTLNAFSLLDVPPGQDTSFVYNIRSLFIKKRNMNLTEIKQKLQELLESQEVEVNSISNINLELESDTEGECEFTLNNDEDKQIDYTIDNEGNMTFSTSITNVEDEEEVEDIENEEEDSEEAEKTPVDDVEVEDDSKDSEEEDKKSNGRYGKPGMPHASKGKKITIHGKGVKTGTGSKVAHGVKLNKPIKRDVKLEELKKTYFDKRGLEVAQKRWADVGMPVKNENTGEIGKIVALAQDPDTISPEDSEVAIIELLDGTQVTVDCEDINGTPEDNDPDDQWSSLNINDLLDLIVQVAEDNDKDSQEELRDDSNDETEEEDNNIEDDTKEDDDSDLKLRKAKEDKMKAELDDARNAKEESDRKLIEKDNELLRMKNLNDKLRKSPIENVSIEGSAAVDNMSDSENEIVDTKEIEKKKAEGLSRQRYF